MELGIDFMLRPFYRQQRMPFTHWLGGGRVGMDVLETKKISWPHRDSNPGTTFNRDHFSNFED